MRNTYEERIAASRQIERRIRQGTDKLVSASLFSVCAKAAWPCKTAAQIAAIAHTDERTAWRWLSNESEPPACVVAALMVKITERH